MGVVGPLRLRHRLRLPRRPLTPVQPPRRTTRRYTARTRHWGTVEAVDMTDSASPSNVWATPPAMPISSASRVKADAGTSMAATDDLEPGPRSRGVIPRDVRQQLPF